MDFQTFKRILTAFADSPANVDATRGKLTCEIRDDMIEAEILSRQGEVMVRENGQEFSATSWLLNRVARLPILADRILNAVPEPECFICPQAGLLDQLDDKLTGDTVVQGDASAQTMEILSRSHAGSSSVVYLTSDAGEGKTTLINHIARKQAERFKKKDSDWLLVPIALGGRPFLRFDDLVVGFLSNRLRFPLFYFEGFMELVKLGVIVPAFDGFEEMFVQNASGDALSAVGNLMRTLDSSGTVLIAARKAYFDYQDIRMQARLFDSIGTCSVVFSRVSLKRWEKEQFLAYCEKRGVQNGPDLRSRVAERLKNDGHPLLTRAVLVKRLLDVAGSVKSLSELLQQLGNSPNDYFAVFVNAIIDREAHEKWIDTSGDAAKPLLSVQEHMELLANIAHEMWLLSTESLKADVLDLVTDLFCESRKLPASVTFQVKERTKQHALIVATDSSRQFGFDHEEFRNFFLGEAIGRLCIQANPKHRVEMLTLLRKGSLPSQAVESVVSVIRRGGNDKRDRIAKFMQEVASLDGPSSFTHENLARLILRVLHEWNEGEMTLTALGFGVDALRDVHLTNLTFKNCSFATTSLEHTVLEDCSFVDCHFDRVNLHPSAEVHGTKIVAGDFASIQPLGKDEAVYAPALFPALLRQAGFEIPSAESAVQTVVEVPEDANLKLFRRLLRCFQMRTYINEHVLLRKLGPGAEVFIKDTITVLIKARILSQEDIPRDKQHRYHLAVSMERVHDALRRSPKSVNEFIAEFANGGE